MEKVSPREPQEPHGNQQSEVKQKASFKTWLLGKFGIGIPQKTIDKEKIGQGQVHIKMDAEKAVKSVEDVLKTKEKKQTPFPIEKNPPNKLVMQYGQFYVTEKESSFVFKINCPNKLEEYEFVITENKQIKCLPMGVFSNFREFVKTIANKHKLSLRSVVSYTLDKDMEEAALTKNTEENAKEALKNLPQGSYVILQQKRAGEYKLVINKVSNPKNFLDYHIVGFRYNAEKGIQRGFFKRSYPDFSSFLESVAKSQSIPSASPHGLVKKFKEKGFLNIAANGFKNPTDPKLFGAGSSFVQYNHTTGIYEFHVRTSKREEPLQEKIVLFQFTPRGIQVVKEGPPVQPTGLRKLLGREPKQSYIADEKTFSNLVEFFKYLKEDLPTGTHLIVHQFDNQGERIKSSTAFSPLEPSELTQGDYRISSGTSAKVTNEMGKSVSKYAFMIHYMNEEKKMVSKEFSVEDNQIICAGKVYSSVEELVEEKVKSFAG